MSHCHLYQGTEISLVYISNNDPKKAEYAAGAVHQIAGEKFGIYLDCGVVHTEPKDE